MIKEALRLYPPAGTARAIPEGAGFTIRLPDGWEQCLEGFVIYNCTYIIQRDPAVYDETANDFVPERWIGNTDTSEATNAGREMDEKTDAKDSKKKIPAGAWRRRSSADRRTASARNWRISKPASSWRAPFADTISQRSDSARSRWMRMVGRLSCQTDSNYKIKSTMYSVSGDPLTFPVPLRPSSC